MMKLVQFDNSLGQKFKRALTLLLVVSLIYTVTLIRKLTWEYHSTHSLIHSEPPTTATHQPASHIALSNDFEPETITGSNDNSDVVIELETVIEEDSNLEMSTEAPVAKVEHAKVDLSVSDDTDAKSAPDLHQKTCSNKDINPRKSTVAKTIALAALTDQDPEIRDALVETTGYAQYSIYGKFPRNPEIAYFLTTSQPLRKSEGYRTTFNLSVVQISHPLHDILTMYRKAYDTELSEKVLASWNFKTFVRAKADIWRRFVLHWLKRSDKSPKTVRFLPLDMTPTQDQISKMFWMLGMDDREKVTSYMQCVFKQNLQKLQWSMAVKNTATVFKTKRQELMHWICSQLDDEFERLRNVGIDWSNSDEWQFTCFNNKREPHKPIVNLLTTLYKSDNTKRQLELDYAFRRNFNNSYIDKLQIWVEGDDSLIPQDMQSAIGDKINSMKTSTQPLYSDFFNYANKYLDKEIIIISNNDIYWPDESIRLLKEHLKPGMVFSLSRHNNLQAEPASVCNTSNTNRK